MIVTAVFVYGTLRSELHHPLHELLASHSRHRGKAKVRGCLFDLGSYPGMTIGDGVVHGELYEIESELPRILEALDEYEGHEYRREVVDAELASGERVAAWAYVLAHDTNGLRRIESGDYVQSSES